MSLPLHTSIFCTVTALICFLHTLTAQASNNDRGMVNYSYAVFFGTGAYRVKDQTAYVVRVPLSRTMRKPAQERPGIKWLLPALTGFYDYDYDDALKGSAPGHAATMSFVPGLEFEYVMNERWRLKPYGQIGLGRDLKNNENALIYVGGANSHYQLPGLGKWRFALGNTITYTGFNPDDQAAQSMGILGAGLDIIYSWNLRLFEKQTNLANSLIYYWYLDNPDFEQRNNRSQSVNGEFEWSLAVNFAKPYDIMGIKIDRIGAGFRYGNNIKGIRLVTKFPF